MATVAFLQTYATGEPDPFPYRAWRSLAQERGIEIKGHLVRGEHDREAYQTAHQLVEDADALIMTTSSFLHDPSLVSRITARVQSGVPILIKPTPPADPTIRDFLAQFDIEPTGIGLYDPEASPARDPRTLTLERLRDPASFRDSQLFAGVNKLVVVQAQVVRCGFQSFPLLVVPEERAAAVELSTDLPPDWVGRELTCMATFSPSAETVIVISGSILLDRLVGPKSLEWPGENANRRFALNLLDRLVRGQRGGSESDLGYQLYKQIENALMDLLQSALGSTLDEWWSDRVSLPIRQKCAQRQEEERGRFPKQAYLDLTDLKQIFEHNWKVFEPAFRDAGWQGGKSQAPLLVRSSERDSTAGHAPAESPRVAGNPDNSGSGFLARRPQSHCLGRARFTKSRSGHRRLTGTGGTEAWQKGTPNKRMNLTKRGLCLVGWPALARQRRDIFIESRFAGYPR